jgi:hypothetical protein
MSVRIYTKAWWYREEYINDFIPTHLNHQFVETITELKSFLGKTKYQGYRLTRSLAVIK